MSCKYPFMCDCTGCEKCAVPDRYEANAELRRSLGRINRQGIMLGLVAFISIFALGAGGAAVIDQGRTNIKNTRIANVEP